MSINKNNNKDISSAAGPDELVNEVIGAIQDVKGSKITRIDMSKIDNPPAPCFVICQGKSTTQVSAIADNIEKVMHENYGIKPNNIDGMRNSQWIIADYGSMLVHIFLPETRELYNLEELWSDAEITEIEDID